MGFYATTEVRDEKRCYPVFRTHKSENRLIKTESLSSVPDAAKVKVENVYDYAGRRVRKTVKDDYSGGTYSTTNVTTYVWDRFNIIAEMCDAGYTNYNTWGLDLSGSLQGAGGVGGLLAVTRVTSSETNTYFPCFDGNGNVCQYVDESGTVVAHREYSPFGATIALTGDKKNDFTHWWSTKPWDAKTGISEYEHRPYIPSLGRFGSRDPLGDLAYVILQRSNRRAKPVGLPAFNLFGFVQNNPINQTDYLGRESNEDETAEDTAKKEAEQNRKNLAQDLYSKLVALCSSSTVILPSNTGPAPGYTAHSGWINSHCCTPESCKEQAKALSDAMADFATKVALAEKLKHGKVIGGSWGNIVRSERKPPGQNTGMEGHGLPCSDWQRYMRQSYNDALGSYGKGGTLCFRGASVSLHRSWFWIYEEKQSFHAWFVLFGPKTLSSGSGGTTIIDVGNPDVTIDPWQSGGLELVPSKPYGASRIDALTKW